MATHANILAWEIPWRNLVSYSPWGLKELDTIWQLNSNNNSYLSILK